MNKFFKKNIVSIKAYLPDFLIDKMILSCQLQARNESWRHWYDQLGNLLYVDDNKKIHIKNNKEKCLITDIYLLSNIEHLKQISEKFFVEDNIFYSIDRGILRLRKVETQELIMPLELGLKKILDIVSNYER